MLKNGLCFKVLKTNIYGIIDGVSTADVYSMVFYQDGYFYLRADVTEGTIKDNLHFGLWQECEPQPYMV